MSLRTHPLPVDVRAVLAPILVAIPFAACSSSGSLPITDVGEGVHVIDTPDGAAPPSCGVPAEDQPAGSVPLLLNSQVVEVAMRREYRAEMRDQGISGTTHTWVCIEEDGRVSGVAVDRTSGSLRLDRAALRIGLVMRFAAPVDGVDWASISLDFSRETGPGLGEEIRRGG
jgi:TonB family protein